MRMWRESGEEDSGRIWGRGCGENLGKRIWGKSGEEDLGRIWEEDFRI